MMKPVMMAETGEMMRDKTIFKIPQPLRAATLAGYDNGDVSVTVGNQTLTFPKAEVALVRLRVDF